MSEQSTQENFGRDSVEAAQGYTPMKEPHTGIADNEPFAKAYEKDNDWRLENDGAPTIVERQYVSEGSNWPRPKKESVELERAARDLGEIRADEFKVQEALRDKQLADEVENLKKSPLRAEADKARAEGEAARAAAEAQQEQEAESQSADHDLSRVLQENPRLMEAIQQQRQADWAGANQTMAAAERWIQDSAMQATAGVFVAFPELQNISLQELPIALNMMQRQNPQRYAQVAQHINAIQGMVEQSNYVQRQQQQRAAQQFQTWAKANDEAWEAEFAKEAPHRQAAIRQEALQMLRDRGLTDEQISWNWNNNHLLRSAAGQQVLADAAAWRLQQKAAQTMRPTHRVPKVQRPGSPVERAPEGDVDLRNLSNKLEQTGSARDAAALLAARRSRSR